MPDNDVVDLSQDFHARSEQGFARIKDERARNVYGLAIASLDQGKLASAHADFDELSKDSANKGVPKVSDIPRQLELACPLVVSWELADSAPLKILGLGRGVTHVLHCAKALGHHVTIATTPNPVHDRLMVLYGLDHFVQKRAYDVPNTKFDAIVSANLLHIGTDRWATFFRPLMPAMAEDGKMILTVLRRPMPERGFDPEVVLAMFEQLGAQVSRKDFSIRLNKQQIVSLIASVPRQAAPVAAEPSGVLELQIPIAPSIAEPMTDISTTPARPAENRSRPPGVVVIAIGAAILVVIAVAWWMWTRHVF